MSRPPANLARNRVRDLLDDTVNQAQTLQAILTDERVALEAQDPDTLGGTVDNKTACIDKLRQLDEQRCGLCRDFGFADGPEQMNELIAWCDEADQVRLRWNRLMVVAAESAAMNLTNGAIIRIRQQQFEAGLNVLRGMTPGMDTYSHNGTTSGDLGHRALAEA